jgi:hypothetical protein
MRMSFPPSGIIGGGIRIRLQIVVIIFLTPLATAANAADLEIFSDHRILPSWLLLQMYFPLCLS